MELIPAPDCPVCGGDGPVAFTGCRDHTSAVPGAWTFRRCRRCASLWLDPRPAPEAIPRLYPAEYFTHAPPQPPLQPPRAPWPRLRFSLTLAIIERAYGYPGLARRAPLRSGAIAGKILGRLPALATWAGYPVRFLRYRPRGRLLDVGAGNGAFLWLMGELGWDAVGLEPDHRAVESAAALGLRLIEGSVERVELAAQGYDAITLAHALEHLPAPQGALRALVAALQPGGVLVSISPNPAGVLARWFRRDWRELDPPRHLVLPSPRGYRLLLEHLGVQGRVWTTMQLPFWVCRESLGVRRTGRFDGYRGWLLPRVLGWAARLAALAAPDGGEEVVCLIVKE